MLKVTQLTVGYRGAAVATLPSLTLEGGQAALLLGPSGSGKTSLLLAMAGLVDILEGAVRIDGTELTSLSAGALDQFRGRNIGLVFQDLHLIWGLSTLDNVLLAAFAAGAPQDEARALRLLSRLGLEAQARSKAETLSRGQAQRVAIARAMLLQPKLLLADEPTASLDDAACAAVAELLLEAATDTGAALLVASHDHRLLAAIPRTVTFQALAAAAA